MRSTLSFVVAALIGALQASAQENAAPDPLKFEVASIKVANSGSNGVRGGCRGVDSVYTAEEQARGGVPSLGRCVITDARLSHLIGIAYGVSMQVLDTGPDWIQRGDLRFDVQAKAENPASTTRQQLLTMLQNLLVERFQIKFHNVIKEEPGFALMVAKNGPKLQPSASEEEKLTFVGPNGEELPKPMGHAIKVNARKFSVSALKDLIAFAGNLGPGVDRTGLTGLYDFTLSWNEEEGPSLASALRDQLGLQLRSEKLPVARFVLDSAQKPTPN
uniref:TIGR03435 family protein n=1 Tax=Solibacter usitatus (strain Ellin6076) TaxID=234267 RepID=Q01YC9_SOLUE